MINPLDYRCCILFLVLRVPTSEGTKINIFYLGIEVIGQMGIHEQFM